MGLTPGLLPRRRDGTDLQRHAHFVGTLPLLDDLVALDAVYDDSGDAHLITGGSEAHQFGLVGTLRPLMGNNFVPFGYRLRPTAVM